MENATCKNCKHLEYIEDESDGITLSAGYLCYARSGVSNLKQFPFKSTKCGEHKITTAHQL